MPGNLTRVTRPTAQGSRMAFWLSDVERMGEADDEWGFTIYGDKNVFLATFVYSAEEPAKAARQAIIPVLADAVFIATEES